jgi:uncharacterized protein YecE (DUF72 family)
VPSRADHDWLHVLGRAEYLADSRRLRTLVGEALSGFPPEVPPLRSVSEVRMRKRATRGTVGLTTYHSTGSRSVNGRGMAAHGTQTITFYSELLDELSDDAAKGVIVHELAHAWLNEHVSPRSSRRREAEADKLARAWGYGRYLDALDAETDPFEGPRRSARKAHPAERPGRYGAGGVTNNLYVGVSGFSYSSWKGKFYPKETKSEELLAYYARRLNSVEINSSFYAAPRPATVESWSAKTDEKFRFAFKAPKQITHILKLGAGSSEAAERLSRVLDLLGPRRGPILFQLAPYSKQDLGLLEEFLSSTSDIESRVFEFRHESWLNDPTFKLLEKHGAGFCIAETEDLGPVFRVTSALAYFRLRKDSYDAKAIDKWAARITEAAKDSRECYAFLRHDETGENGVLAQRLAEKITAT